MRQTSTSEVFGRIAPAYDRMNALMSLGRDRAWRASLVRQAQLAPDARVLDVGCGTGELSAAILQALGPAGRLIGVDTSPGMLARAGRRLRDPRLSLVEADCRHLPHAEGSFHAVLTAFTLRNVEPLAQALQELRRVLVPGGRMLSLELVRPRSWPGRLLHRAYFCGMVPLLGRLVAGDRAAYAYLGRSMATFLSARELGQALREAGFQEVGWRGVVSDVLVIHAARRPEESP